MQCEMLMGNRKWSQTIVCVAIINNYGWKEVLFSSIIVHREAIFIEGVIHLIHQSSCSSFCWSIRDNCLIQQLFSNCYWLLSNDIDYFQMIILTTPKRRLQCVFVCRWATDEIPPNMNQCWQRLFCTGKWFS